MPAVLSTPTFIGFMTVILSGPASRLLPMLGFGGSGIFAPHRINPGIIRSRSFYE